MGGATGNTQVLTAMEATSVSHARELAEMKAFCFLFGLTEKFCWLPGVLEEAYDASLNALCRKHGHAEERCFTGEANGTTKRERERER